MLRAPPQQPAPAVAPPPVRRLPRSPPIDTGPPRPTHPANNINVYEEQLAPAQPSPRNILTQQDDLYEEKMVEEGVLLPAPGQVPVPSLPQRPPLAAVVYQRTRTPAPIPVNPPPILVSPVSIPINPAPIPANPLNSTYYQYPPRPGRVADSIYVIPPADYDELPEPRNYTVLHATGGAADEVKNTERAAPIPLAEPPGANQRRLPRQPTADQLPPEQPAVHQATNGSIEQEIYDDIMDYGNVANAPAPTAPAEPLPQSPPPSRQHDQEGSPVETSAPWPDDMYVEMQDPSDARYQTRTYEMPRPVRQPPKPKELTEEEKRQAKLKELIKKHTAHGQTPFSYAPILFAKE